MPTPFPRSLAVLGAAFMLAAAAGCSGSSQQNAGSVRVAVSSSALAAGVTEVIVTVGPGTGLPSFAPFSVALSNVQGTWSGYITNIPAGTQRTFDVVANDSSHAQVQAGSGKADVAAGKSAVVVVTMGSTVPSNPFGNNSPVIDYVSASQTSVLPGGTVRLSISAHDPDPGDTVTILWSAACGTIDAPASSVVTWTAPATTGPCQVTAKASDNRGASVSVYLSLDVAAATSGDVLVEVKDGGNASPVITAMTADVKYRSPVQGSLSVQATDPNGDMLAYAWSSSCATVTFATQAAATTTFTNSDGSKSCVVTVDVTDGKGGKVTGDVTLPPNILFNLAPVITHTVQPSVDLTDPRLAQPVSTGDAVLLSVEAKDPENLNLTFTWTTNAGTLDGQVDLPVPPGTPAPHVTTSPGKSVILFHVGTTIPADARVTVTVRDAGNEATSHDYNFKAATGTGPCANQPNGTTCDDGNPCTTTSSCQGGVCVGANPVVCAAPAACKQAGVCQTSGPSAGTCTYADSATGTACDDGRACTSPDTCAAGVCMSGPSTCTGGQTCSTAGVCVPGACVPACTGKTCGSDGCGGVCGACTGTDVCSAAGTCGPPVCTPNCTGKTCGPDGCGGTCAPGCTGTNTCNASGACVAASTGVSPLAANDLRISPPAAIAMDAAGNTFVVGTIASTTPVNFQTRPGGPAIDLASVGGTDIFVASYGTDGNVNWALGVGDDDPATDIQDQSGKGVAVTADGTAVITGKVVGTVTFGTNTIISAGGVPFVAGMHAAGPGVDPLAARLWARSFNLGSNGFVSSMASNVGLTGTSAGANRFAVCGQANVAATQLVAGCSRLTATGVPSTQAACTTAGGTWTVPTTVVFNGGQAGALPDAVIAVFDSGGNRIWGFQLQGGVNTTEACNSIAIGDNGDVYATGWFDSASLTFPTTSGTPLVLNSPGADATKKYMWVARYNAAGVIQGATAFTGTANINPQGIAVAPSTATAPGDAFVVGAFTGTATIGGPIVDAGNGDAFYVKLTGSSLQTAWNAQRFGGGDLDQLKSVGTTSTGDAVMIGSIGNAGATGAVTLVSAGQADIAVVKVSGATGAANFSAAYGNNLTQTGDQLSVNRAGTNQVSYIGTISGTVAFPPAASITAVSTDASLVFATTGP
jgi:hypothetical protein